MSFVLNPQIEADSTLVVDLPLCQVRLNHNAAFPWIVLIPRVDKMVELIDLGAAQQDQVWQEIRTASHVMKSVYQPDKLNVANLGNVVAQLHIHVIARFASDKAWPGPVWNSGQSASYDSLILKAEIKKLQDAFREFAE